MPRPMATAARRPPVSASVGASGKSNEQNGCRARAPAGAGGEGRAGVSPAVWHDSGRSVFQMSSAEAVLGAGEAAVAHLAAVGLGGADDGRAEVGVLLDEARPQLVEQPEHVVRDEDLPVAAGAGADADGR